MAPSLESLRRLPLAVLTALATALAACGGGDSGSNPDPDPDPDPKPVATVEITPTDPSAFEDGSVQLSAVTRAADGSVLSGRTITWSSSNAAVGAIGTSGRFEATDPGETTVTATTEGRSAEVTLTVLRSNTVTIRLSADELLLGTSDIVTLTAEAIDSAGRTLRNRAFAWSTDAPAVATAQAGEVAGVAEGMTVLRVTSDGAEGTATVDIFTMRGQRIAELVAVDEAVVAYMRANGIPGGVAAVLRDGRLVHSRGYGVTDGTSNTPMEPDQAIRWGSVSKPIAGVAALMLVEQGVISLDDLPFQAIPPLPGETPDPRIAGVTLQNLLDHAGGWDNARAVDNRLWIEGINQDGVRDHTELIRYGLGVPLDHDPGTTYAYSNYATQVVAEHIAAATGTDFEEWAQQNIFGALDAEGPRFGTGDPAQEPDQPTYHDVDGTPLTVPVLDLIYSGASGAWVGPIQALARFVNGIEGRNGPALIESATLDLLSARPEAIWPGNGYYYTGFMEFRPSGDGLDWYHSGQPRGGIARFWRRPDGTTWITVFNRTPGGAYPDLNAAVEQVASWPEHDLFDLFDGS